MMRLHRSRAGIAMLDILIGLALAAATSAAVVMLLNRSSASATSASAIAQQNARLRAAMNTIQSTLAYAEKPLIYVGWANQQASEAEGQPAWGTSVEYVRAVERADGGRTYRREKFRYWDRTAAEAAQRPELANTLTIQSEVVARNVNAADGSTVYGDVDFDDFTDQDGDPVEAPEPSVLIDRLVQPSVEAPIFKYMARAGVPVALTRDDPTLAGRQNVPVPRDGDQQQGVKGWKDEIALIDVTLRRDVDGPHKLLDDAAGPKDEVPQSNLFRPSSLTSSIYLQRVDRAQGTSSLLC